jgi:putative ATP-dependent DNA ligase
VKSTPVGEVGPDLWEEAKAKGLVRDEEHEGLCYRRLNADLHTVMRGTALVEGRVLPAFPHIGRILALGAGMKKHLSGRFRLEEKIDGYNVRVIRVEGRILPFTRGGYVCPFTEDRLPELVDLHPFFDAHPDLILCAEISGRGNPYSASPSQRVGDDVELHAFDLMRFDRSEFIGLEECDRILTELQIPRAPIIGWFEPSQTAEVKQHVLELDKLGAEGIVFKPLNDGLRIKYVTPTTNLCDITRDVHLLAELQANTFVLRLLRLVIAIEELSLQDRLPELEQALGSALLAGFLQTVEHVRDGLGVSEQRRLRLTSSEGVDRLERHLNRVARGIRIRELARRTEGDHTTVDIEKTFISSTDRIRDLLEGAYVID